MNHFKSLPIRFSLAIAAVSVGLLTSCAPSPGTDSRFATHGKGSSSSSSALMESDGAQCMDVSPYQTNGVTDSGHFQACRTPGTLEAMTLDGFFDDVTEVCVFPIQTVSGTNITTRQNFKVDANGMPYSECGHLVDGQVLRITFPKTVFDSVIVVPKSDRANLQSCLTSMNNCPEYSFGHWTTSI